MTPWVGKLISSFRTKASLAPIKIDRTTNLLDAWR
jgi:hypothetical protein